MLVLCYQLFLNGYYRYQHCPLMLAVHDIAAEHQAFDMIAKAQTSLPAAHFQQHTSSATVWCYVVCNRNLPNTFCNFAEKASEIKTEGWTPPIVVVPFKRKIASTIARAESHFPAAAKPAYATIKAAKAAHMHKVGKVVFDDEKWGKSWVHDSSNSDPDEIGFNVLVYNLYTTRRLTLSSIITDVLRAME